MTEPNRTCLSYWFPLIEAAGLPVPRTEIVRTSCELMSLLDGETPDGFVRFRKDLMAAALYTGLPCFLRTGFTSHKHQWRDTCYLSCEEDLDRHVFKLIEFSAMCDFMGLATDVWAVREMIPTTPAFVAFQGMPIVREFRVFTRDNRVSCIHFYWPFFRPWVASVIEGPNLRDKLIAFLRRCWANSPDTTSCNDLPIPASLSNYAGVVDDVLVSSNFFAQFDDQFGLAFLEPQVRQQECRYIGGLLTRNTPIPQWLSVRCAGWDESQGWPAEGVLQESNALFMDLLDLDEGDERLGALFELFSGLLDLDAKAAVSIEQSSTICENGWLVFHGLHDTITGECTQVVATFFQECPVASGGAYNWRSSSQQMAILSPAERARICEMAEEAAQATDYGDWSIDFLEDSSGNWWLTDMAEAARSWHWPGCEAAV